WRVILVAAIVVMAGTGAIAFAATRGRHQVCRGAYTYGAGQPGKCVGSSGVLPPVATTAQFLGLRSIVNDAWAAARTAGEPDEQSALIVSTKRHSAFGQLPGQFDPRHDPAVYLV